MKESKISIKKEVLTITRLNDDTLDVKVEYTFFNPNKAKKVLVGFEASEPDGDVQSESKNGEHPYMKNFSVIINGKRVAYKVSGGINGTDFGYVYQKIKCRIKYLKIYPMQEEVIFLKIRLFKTIMKV